jgi:hypothetical protein
MMKTATYVYCVVQRSGRPSAARAPGGLPGAGKPRLLDLGRSLWCVVAEVPLDRYGQEQIERGFRDLQWVADAAVAHEGVIEHFTRMRDTTVVPMKLFTIFSSPDRAIAEMQARRAELSAVLKRIKGCEEWGVRITRTPIAITPAMEVPSGAAFLSAKKRARDTARDAVRRAAEAANDAYEMLAPHARAARRREDVPDAAPTPPLLEATFLVPASRKARFRALARRAAGACRLAGAELTLTGPWPAYNFVQPPERSA